MAAHRSCTGRARGAHGAAGRLRRRSRRVRSVVPVLHRGAAVARHGRCAADQGAPGPAGRVAGGGRRWPPTARPPAHEHPAAAHRRGRDVRHGRGQQGRRHDPAAARRPPRRHRPGRRLHLRPARGPGAPVRARACAARADHRRPELPRRRRHDRHPVLHEAAARSPPADLVAAAGRRVSRALRAPARAPRRRRVAAHRWRPVGHGRGGAQRRRGASTDGASG